MCSKQAYASPITPELTGQESTKFKLLMCAFLYCRSDAQRAAKQKEAKERELEQVAFSADRIEEGGFPLSMVSSNKIFIYLLSHTM